MFGWDGDRAAQRIDDWQSALEARAARAQEFAQYVFRSETSAEFGEETRYDLEAVIAVTEFVGAFGRITKHLIHLGRPASAGGSGIGR